MNNERKTDKNKAEQQIKQITTTFKSSAAHQPVP
jgi:hypothetical protein